MSNSTRSTRELLDAIDERWPSGHGATWADAVESRLDALLAPQPASVVRRVHQAVEDPASEAFARTLIYALQIANSVGLKAAGWLAEDRLHMIDAQGRALALGLVGVDAPATPAGNPAALEDLQRALDEAFGDRRYVLWLRRPLPAEIDAPAIGRATTLWLSAIDRGEWHGSHAVYEDEAVELELMLTEGRGRVDGTCQVLRLEPVTALERLSVVDGAVIDKAATHEEEQPDIPLVFVVGCGSPMRLPRGFAEQLLYGTADWVRSSTGPSSYEAAFYPSGRSLFSDPLAANICSIWWTEPSGDDPLGFRSWSHANPWTRAAWSPEAPPGPRFVREGSDKGSAGRKVEVMRWRSGT